MAPLSDARKWLWVALVIGLLQVAAFGLLRVAADASASRRAATDAPYPAL